jgi:MFS family permease
MTDVVADRTYRALLSVPSLWRVLLGMTVARTAQSMLGIAMVLFALDRYGSPPLAGLVTFASIFPGLVVAPIAGALLDRHGRSRLVVLDYLVAGSALWLIAILAVNDALPPALLVLIAAAGSLTSPLSLAGLRSLLPLLVPEPLWERANAFDSNGYVVASLLGPPIAGAIFALWGGPAAIAVIGFVFASAAIVTFRVPDPETNVDSSGSLLGNAWQGLLYTVRNPTLRALAVSISVLNLAGGVLQIAVPVVIIRRLGLGPEIVGAAWAILGVSGMVAAMVFGRIDSAGREKALIAWPTLGMAGSIALLLIPGGLPIVLLALAINGFLNGPIDIGLFTVRQRRTDPSWMGRAFAVSMALNFLGFPIGSAISGALIETSFEATIVLGVAACAAASLAAWTMLPRNGGPT